MNNPFEHKHSADAVDAVHKRSDVDSGPRALHHTLGWNAGQAAPGKELQALVRAGAFGRVGDYQWNDSTTETDIWKLANGQLLNIADYPDAFAHFGTRYGGNGTTTFGLPDIREHVLGMQKSGSIYGFQNAIGTKIGGGSHNLAHTHTTASHTHTGAAHTHSISSDGAHAHGGSTANNSDIVTRQGGSNSNVPAPNHSHSISTGGGHDHGAATGAASAGNTGSATPSTDSTTFATPSFGGLYGNAEFSQIQFTLVTNCFVRVKLGL